MSESREDGVDGDPVDRELSVAAEVEIEKIARLVPLDDVADRLGISRSGVYLLLEPMGSLRTVRVNRRRFVRLCDLVAFIEQLSGSEK